MNINTSNYWSASSASSHGMSGLVSGLDTEKMVEQMLMGTQKKIDAQKGLQQTTNWRQEMYRDIITSINDLRTKYFNTAFDATSNMNFASEAFFNTMKASLTSGSGVKVISADSSALTGDMKVKVDQLASAAKVETEQGHTISSNTVTGSKLDTENLKEIFDKTMTIELGEGSKTKVTVDFTGVETQEDVVKRINDALKAADVTDVTASMDGESVMFTVAKDSKNQIQRINPTGLAGKITGLSNMKTDVDDEGNTIIRGSGRIDPNANVSFDVELDGINKTISLDNITDTSNLTPEKISQAINEKLNKAFGNNVLETKVVGGALQFGFAQGYDVSGHSFRLTGVDLNEFGITPGASSHVSYSTKLGDLPGISGGMYEFEINGEKFKFDKNTTLGEMMTQINSSGAGVKLSYSTLGDKFVLESSSTGANYSITASQSQGNLLTVMFGDSVVKPGSSVTSDKLTTNSIKGKAIVDDAKINEGVINFTVNGKDYTFSLPRKGDDKTYTKKEFETKFNEYLKTEFGDGISYDGNDGQLKIKAGYEVSITSTSVSGEVGGKQTNIDLGLEGKDNTATDKTKLSEIANLSKMEIQNLGGDNVTLGSLKGDVKFEDGRLVVNAEGAKKLPDLIGNVELGNGQLVGEVVKGTDAIVTINGVKTTRSSNTFTVDGITMELTGVHKEGEEAVIGTTRDIDTIIEGFESFVKDYNAMLDKLYGYTDAKAEYRDYPPLTDAQKKEMSDREIELWEEKAKTGLLRRDTDVEHFLSSMRTAMYEKPAGCKFALYDIGVETGTYTSKGKLTLDTTKLRNALAEDPASVEQLFLDATEGLSNKLVDIMKDTANLSSGSPGTLVQLAGAEGYGTEDNNTLSRNLKEIEGRIKDLEKKYEKEKNRYWNQFNRMEQILANFNAQSGMIQSQFMGMGY